MNDRLLSDEALRNDLYVEMMFTAGTLGFYKMPYDIYRPMIEEQIDLLIPVVKKHIKRHKRALKENK